MGNGEVDPTKKRGNEYTYRTLGNSLIVAGVTAFGIATTRLEPIDQTLDDYHGRIHDLQEQRPDIAAMRETVYEFDKSVSEDPVVVAAKNESDRQGLIFLGAAVSTVIGTGVGFVVKNIRKR